MRTKRAFAKRSTSRNGAERTRSRKLTYASPGVLMLAAFATAVNAASRAPSPRVYHSAYVRSGQWRLYTAYSVRSSYQALHWADFRPCAFTARGRLEVALLGPDPAALGAPLPPTGSA